MHGFKVLFSTTSPWHFSFYELRNYGHEIKIYVHCLHIHLRHYAFLLEKKFELWIWTDKQHDAETVSMWRTNKQWGMNNEFNKTQKCKNILYRDWIKYNLDIEFRMYLQRYVQWRTQLQLIVTPLIFPQYKIIRGHKCCHIVLKILLLIEKWKQRAIVNEICKIKFKESLNVLTLVHVSNGMLVGGETHWHGKTRENNNY